MRKPSTVLRLIVCLTLVGTTVVGCSNTNSGASGNSTGSSSGSGGMMGGGGSSGGSGGMMGGIGSSTGSYSSVGEQIWLTGIGTSGTEIGHSAPRTSQGALMMGGGGCASCHGADGRGGTVRMMMGPTIDAPDVTYGALIKAGFKDATIRAAITQGLDEAGKPLKDAMPRWQMGTSDLDATIAYLKVLGP